MSLNETKKLSQIRSLVAKRRLEMSAEMDAMGTAVAKKLCRQWVDELCDIITATDTASILSPSNQPYIDINRCATGTDTIANTATTAATNPSDITADDVHHKENARLRRANGHTSGEPSTASTSSGGDNRAKDEPRYKGVIRGMDSIAGHHSDDNWEPEGSGSGAKRPKASTRGTRSRGRGRGRGGAKKKASDDRKEAPNPENLWQSDGKVLGGETQQVITGEMTAAERREYMALMAEQRLGQLGSRGAHGVVRLPASRLDGGDSGPTDPNSLRWQI
jgi:hypothetical protein